MLDARLGSTVLGMTDTMTALQWRPLTGEDAPAWAELLAAAERVDQTGENYSVADLAEELQNGSIDLTRDTWAVLHGEQLVAVGFVHGDNQVWDVDNVHCFGDVHPAYRGRGIGRRLLGEQLARAEAMHRERHPGHRALISMRPYDHVTPSVNLARAAGLEPVRHFFDMERDLRHDAPPRRDPAAPLRVVPYVADRDDEVRRAHNTAFRDHFGCTERDASVWKQWFAGSRSFRAELSFLACDGEDRVAGYLLGYFHEADAEADGYRKARIGQLGTLPQWRGQGAASALLSHALAAYRDAGYERSGLDVDSANGTGALGMYERVGFRTVRSSTSWAREIPARPAG